MNIFNTGAVHWVLPDAISHGMLNTHQFHRRLLKLNNPTQIKYYKTEQCFYWPMRWASITTYASHTHSVESPIMVDPQWNIWYWSSKWNLHTICCSAVGCEWAQPLFTLGSFMFALSLADFLSCCWAPVPTSRFFIFVKSIIWITHTKSSKNFMLV